MDDQLTTIRVSRKHRDMAKKKAALLSWDKTPMSMQDFIERAIALYRHDLNDHVTEQKPQRRKGAK
jgi:hypothetical protein